MKSPRKNSALPQAALFVPGCTSIHFGENQLSPLSIGISPLSTVHPSGLQSTPVRASTHCYARFTLTMDSSSGFGSTRRDYCPVQTRVRSGSGCDCLNQATAGNSPDHAPKGTPSGRGCPPGPSTACKQTVSGSISLPSPGYFSPFPHGTVHYRSLRVASLGQWAARLHTALHVCGATQDRFHGVETDPNPALTVSGGVFQTPYGGLNTLHVRNGSPA